MTIVAKIEENDEGWIWVWLTMTESKSDHTWRGKGRYNMGCFQIRVEDESNLAALLEATRERKETNNE